MRGVHRVVRVFEVGGKRVDGIAVDTAHHVLVELPQIFEAGRLREALHRRGAAALAGAVVEHGDPRLHRKGSRRRLAAVSGRLVHVDRSDPVLGTEKRDFLVPGEIAEVRKPEPAVLDDDAHRGRVLGIAVRTPRDVAAVRVRRTARVMGLPSASTTVTSSPLTEILSPGDTTTCLPFANAAAQSSAYSPVFCFIVGASCNAGP